MVIIVLLWGLLHGRGIWCLTGPSKVIVRSGSPVVVQCVYDGGYEDYVKFWCKGLSSKYCTIQIQTTADSKEITTGRFAITDTPAMRSFNVTMVDTRHEDADTYYCGIERTGYDIMHKMEVEVLPGVCHVTAPWTDIVDFPSNFTGIEADRVVELSCLERYGKKNITLQCREESGGFALSPQSDGDYCFGVCRSAPPWTHIVDFPENFTEIAVKASVVVSCQRRYAEKTLRLQCREESGEFLLSPADGEGSCTDNKMSALTKIMSSLVTSTIGFLVPFLVKLLVLLVILVGRTFWMINTRFRKSREERDRDRSLERRNIDPQQKTRRRQEKDVSSPQVEVPRIYENLEEESNKSPTKK